MEQELNKMSSPEEGENKQNTQKGDLSERLDAALQKLERTDEPEESYEIQNEMVLVSDALALANEKLKKLQSSEEVNKNKIQETKQTIEKLEEKQNNLRKEEEENIENREKISELFNTAEELGTKLYQLHMRITEREEQGMNPLITPEPLQSISQKLLTANDKGANITSADDFADSLGRDISNTEILRSRGGPVREDPEMLEDILALVRHCSEDIDTLRRQINQEVFTEETAQNLYRVMETLESVIDQLGNRVYKKLDSLQGY